MEQEIWKVIESHPMYEVSNLGKVRKISSGKLLKQCLDSKGYPSVNVNDGKKATRKVVHRFVAKAFIPNPENKPMIDHLDRNRQNNHVTNIRWCTMSENMLNPLTRNFRRDMYIGIERPCVYKPVVAIKDGVVVKQYESIKSAIKDGFTGCCISNCCSGRDKTHKEYSWMYLSDYENSCHQ